MKAGEEQEGGEVFAKIGAPDLVVWPETCLPSEHYSFWIDGEGSSRGGPLLEDYLDETMALGRFSLIFGANELRELPDGKLEIFNSMVIEQPGRARTSSKKNHLVILGEYIPDLPFLHDFYYWTTGVRFFVNMLPGESWDPLSVEIDGREVGVMPSICFEDTVGRVMRRFVRDDTQVIVNLTNDGWFQESEGAMHHFRNALFRCIELRRPMVRCANRGVTGVVSTTGSLVDPVTGETRSLVDENGSHFHRGFLLASVYLPVEAETTLYAAFGDWFAVVGLAVGLLWMIWSCLGNRGKRATAGGRGDQT
jgi:apolipoprotein N-acyltransferase